MVAYQEPTIDRKRLRRCQQQEVLPSYLFRDPSLINHWNSSIAWVLNQNEQMFSG